MPSTVWLCPVHPILKEVVLFFGGRAFSGVVDTLLMVLFIEVLLVGDFVSKIIIQVIVVILNYVISKLIVFK
jgi:putative flippase GtrA